MKAFISCCLFYFPIIVFAQKTNTSAGKFTINGTITDRDTGYIYLNYIDANEGYTKKSCSLKKGHFNFQGIVSSPCMATLYLDKNHKSIDDSLVTEFFIQPGNIKVKANYHAFKKLIVWGSAAQSEYEEYLKKSSILSQKQDTIYNELKKFYKENIQDSIAIQKLLSERENIRNQQIRFDLDYISNFPNSFISAYLLMYKINWVPADTIQKYFIRLSPSAQRSINGNIIYDYLLRQNGSKAPYFEGYDINGKIINLNQYKNKKILLLYFWASYCIPCRTLTPYLKKLYQQYHPFGLEIIGIADDDKRIDAWKKEIYDEQLFQWPQVLQQAGTKKDIGKLFGVSAIHCVFIIDKKGVIVLRLEGTEEKEKIDSVLKEIVHK